MVEFPIFPRCLSQEQIPERSDLRSREFIERMCTTPVLYSRFSTTGFPKRWAVINRFTMCACLKRGYLGEILLKCPERTNMSKEGQLTWESREPVPVKGTRELCSAGKKNEAIASGGGEMDGPGDRCVKGISQTQKDKCCSLLSWAEPTYFKSKWDRRETVKEEAGNSGGRDKKNVCEGDRVHA